MNLGLRVIERGPYANHPRDAAVVLAQIEIIRTLRRSGLDHIRKGHPGAVGFIVPEDEVEVFADAAQEMLRRYAGGKGDVDYDVSQWSGGKASGMRRTGRNALERLLSGTSRVFGFAARAEDFPKFFHEAADAVVETGPVDVRALEATFHIVTGAKPPHTSLDPGVGQPRPLLGIAIKHGRGACFAMRTLERVLARIDAVGTPAVPSSHPSLEELHGMAEAAEWGHRLAGDIAEYSAGRIAWSDVDPGVLVEGPPGTGKTTFGRALAKTCGIPIHIHSLAQWQAKGYLNDVLRTMRAAFDDAMSDAPCILFLDEMDCFGDRGSGGRNEDYWRVVINGLLECLDGAVGRDGVVVVGATNFPGKIDPAILRPGRLDRTVTIPLPDAPARAGILRHHLGGSALPDTDLSVVANRLEGASGANLAQIVRDARRVARSHRRAMVLEDLEAVLPKQRRLSAASRRRACVHEAGHALVGQLLRDETGTLPTRIEVLEEIAPNGSGGRTTMRIDPGFDRTRGSHLADITFMLAGLAAERVVLGENGDGGGGADQSDLHRATVRACEMETSFGLGDSLVYLAACDSPEMLGWIRLDPGLKRRIDACLSACMERAVALVEADRPTLDAIVADLEANGSIDGAALAAFGESLRKSAKFSQSSGPGNGPVTNHAGDREWYLLRSSHPGYVSVRCSGSDMADEGMTMIDTSTSFSRARGGNAADMAG